MRKILAPAMLLPLFAGCMANGPGEPRPLNERDQRRLSSWLDGRTPSAPESCITSMPGLQTAIIGDSTILYRDGRTVWRNDVGPCPGLSENRTIVTRTPTNRLCQGDIIRIVDTMTGTEFGACGLGAFVPYRE